MTSSRTISSRFLQKLIIINISTFSYQLRKNSIDKDECGLYKVQLINKNGIFTTFYDVIIQGKVISRHLFLYIYSLSADLNNLRIDLKTDFKLMSHVVCSSFFLIFKFLVIKEINLSFKNRNYLFRQNANQSRYASSTYKLLLP